MRRADRLFQIVQILRTGKLTTARMLADKLEVSERTIYRDIADLQGSGVPIDGEAGIGYLMRDGYDLPPLMFTRDEMEAMIVGARMVAAWGGAKMAFASETALGKIENVLPEPMRGASHQTAVFAFDLTLQQETRKTLDQLNAAIEHRDVLEVSYKDAEGNASSRELEPLGLYFWGKVWTLVAWCRLRNDYRSFRVDRLFDLIVVGNGFSLHAEKNLRHYLKRQADREGYHPPASMFGDG